MPVLQLLVQRLARKRLARDREVVRPSVHQVIFRFPTYVHTTKFCTVIKLDVRQILRGRPRILTRDLFAVAAVAYLLVTVRCRSLLFTSAASSAVNDRGLDAKQ